MAAEAHESDVSRLRKHDVANDIREVREMRPTGEPLEGRTFETTMEEVRHGLKAPLGLLDVCARDLNDDANIGDEAELSGSGHNLMIQPAVSNDKAAAPHSRMPPREGDR